MSSSFGPGSEVPAGSPQALTLDEIVEHINGLERCEGSRLIVAIAGPPAAGKSTLADQLRVALVPGAAVLGLDAFHFDNGILEARGHLDRKGAPHTFDVVGYRFMLEMLRSNGDVDVSVPVFDRSLELTRNCAEVVTADQSVVITEGNYLLLDDDRWNGLSDLFDMTIWVAADIGEIEARIVRRWDDLGFAKPEAQRRAEQNDLPNARLVLNGSKSASIRLTQ